jgi:transcriptional regulator with XRE-family HTH domain
MNKLSQTSLALKAGVTQATISRIEKGQQKADVGTFLLLLVALGADLSIIRQQKVSHPDSLDGLF